MCDRRVKPLLGARRGASSAQRAHQCVRGQPRPDPGPHRVRLRPLRGPRRRAHQQVQLGRVARRQPDLGRRLNPAITRLGFIGAGGRPAPTRAVRTARSAAAISLRVSSGGRARAHVSTLTAPCYRGYPVISLVSNMEPGKPSAKKKEIPGKCPAASAVRSTSTNCVRRSAVATSIYCVKTDLALSIVSSGRPAGL